MADRQLKSVQVVIGLILLAGIASATNVTIQTPTVPNGIVGTAYSVTISAKYGKLPYTWSNTGSVPPGLTFKVIPPAAKYKGSTYQLSGIPSRAGSYMFAVTVTGAGGLSDTQTYTINITSNISITVSPASAVVQSGDAQQYTATGDSVIWAVVDCGSISNTGLYLAPQVSTETVCNIKATSIADPTKVGVATCTVEPIPQHTVNLTWNETDGTVTNYNVFRGTTTGGPYTKIANTPNKSYIDSNVGSSGNVYFYVVTGLDGTGTESQMSNEAKAVIP